MGTSPERFLPMREVRKVAGDKSVRTIYRWIQEGHFPSPVRLGPNSVGWSESALNEWVKIKKEGKAISNVT